MIFAFYVFLQNPVEAIDLSLRMFYHFGAGTSSVVSQNLSLLEEKIDLGNDKWPAGYLFTHYGTKWVEGVLWPSNSCLWDSLTIWANAVALKPNVYVNTCVLYDFKKCNQHYYFNGCVMQITLVVENFSKSEKTYDKFVYWMTVHPTPWLSSGDMAATSFKKLYSQVAVLPLIMQTENKFKDIIGEIQYEEAQAAQ